VQGASREREAEGEVGGVPLTAIGICFASI